MDSNTKFIRFSGVLIEGMEFFRSPGWEVSQIRLKEDDDPNGRYKIDLLDEENQVITTVHPSVTLVPGCAAVQRGPRVASVTAYLPLVQHARQVVLRNSDREIYRETISGQPPEIRITCCEMGKGDKVKLKWEGRAASEDKKELRYSVAYIPVEGTAFTIAVQKTDSEMVVDLSNLPGSKRAKIAVMASDGLRSSHLLSEPFEVAHHKPTVDIIEPEDSCCLPAFQPVTFRGISIEPGGKRIDDEHLSWTLDGKPLAQGSALLAVPDVTPGKHEIQLECKSPDSGLTNSFKCFFEVAEPNEEQRRCMKLLQRVASSRLKKLGHANSDSTKTEIRARTERSGRQRRRDRTRPEKGSSSK